MVSMLKSVWFRFWAMETLVHVWAAYLYCIRSGSGWLIPLWGAAFVIGGSCFITLNASVMLSVSTLLGCYDGAWEFWGILLKKQTNSILKYVLTSNFVKSFVWTLTLWCFQNIVLFERTDMSTSDSGCEFGAGLPVWLSNGRLRDGLGNLVYSQTYSLSTASFIFVQSLLWLKSQRVSLKPLTNSKVGIKWKLQ